MSSASSYRAWQATLRRQEREAARALRELEKQMKEHAKQSEHEAAQMEVDGYEAQVAVLLSNHRECTPQVDWPVIAAQLPSPPPVRSRKAELNVYVQLLGRKSEQQEADDLLERARQSDTAIFEQSRREYIDTEEMRLSRANLARRVLRRELMAVEEAVASIDPFSEMAASGTVITYKAHGCGLIECWVEAKGPEVLPVEIKSMTSSGKLSSKPMPRGQLHELFQDYICSCVLRVGREMFAILPYEKVLVHASAPVFEPATGLYARRTVVSVCFDRARLENLNFERLDPSDAVDAFNARSDFKVSRKSGAFVPVEPLSVAVDAVSSRENTTIAELLDHARTLRTAFAQSV